MRYFIVYLYFPILMFVSSKFIILFIRLIDFIQNHKTSLQSNYTTQAFCLPTGLGLRVEDKNVSSCISVDFVVTFSKQRLSSCISMSPSISVSFSENTRMELFILETQTLGCQVHCRPTRAFTKKKTILYKASIYIYIPHCIPYRHTILYPIIHTTLKHPIITYQTYVPHVSTIGLLMSIHACYIYIPYIHTIILTYIHAYISYIHTYVRAWWFSGKLGALRAEVRRFEKPPNRDPGQVLHSQLPVRFGVLTSTQYRCSSRERL